METAPAAPDIRALIRQAVAEGKPRVVIPPGRYRMGPEPGQAVILTVQDVRNLEIVADGVTMLCTKLTRAIEINRCEGLTLRGLTLDYDPPPFTQGTVVASAKDQSWIDVKIHAGYPRKPYQRIDVVDRKTRFRKKGMPFLWGAKGEMRGPDIVRITLTGIGNTAEVGDLASMSTGQGPGGICHGIVISECKNTTFERVTVHCAPGFGIFEAGGEGGMKLLSCRVVPGPRPKGATEERLLTTSWDAMQNQCVRRGPLIEDCVIEDAGDDSWSLPTPWFLIVKREGNTLTLCSQRPIPAGDRLKASNDSPEYVVRECRDVPNRAKVLDPDILEKLMNAPQYSLWKQPDRCIQVTLDREAPFRAGDSLFDADCQGRGFVLRHNTIRSSGRGALIKGSDGLIEGNTFLGSDKAVVLCPETPGEAAGGMENITIRGNTIVEAGYFCMAPWSCQAGAISISRARNQNTLQPPGAFKDIVIEDNTFENVRGLNIGLSSARNVVVRGNRFVGTHQVANATHGQAYSIDQASVIWISQCDGVRLENNIVEKIGRYGRRALAVGPGTNNVTGAEFGIRVGPAAP